MPYTGTDGNCWTPILGGVNQFAFDVYGGQRQPQAIDFYRAYQDIVFSCIKTIADTMAANPPKPFLPKGAGSSKRVKTKRTKSAEQISPDVEEVVDGDLIELLTDPNPRMSMLDIYWVWEQQRHLFGSGYIEKKKSLLEIDDDGEGKPRYLFIRPSYNTYPKMAANFVDIEYYQSGTERIQPEGIIEVCFRDPLNIYGRGFSPVHACWSMLTLKQKHESFLANSYDSNGVPCAVATPEGDDVDADEDTRRTMILDFDTWQTKRKDGGLLIPAKGWKFEFPAATPREIVGKSEELTIINNAVARAFGIPIALFDVAAGNRATLEASLTQFLMLAILPRIRERDAALTKHLAQLYDPRMFFRTDSPVPADEEKKNAVYSMLASNQAVTKNEIRAAYPELKLEQKPEFDSVPNTQAATADFNFDSLPDIPDEVQEQAATASTIAPRSDQSANVLAIQSAVFGGGLPRDAGLAQLITLFGFSIDQANALIPEIKAPEKAVKTLKKRPQATHKALETILRSYFNKQREEVLGSITGETEKSVKAQVGFDLAKANVELFSECFPCINLLAEQTIKKTLIKVKADVSDFTVISHKLQPTIRKMVLQFCDETNKTTQDNIATAYKKVKESLADGIENADSLEAIRKEIGDIYTTAADHRTFAIANTETARVFTTSGQHAAKESGVVRGKTFLVSANACDICQKVAGKYRNKVVPIDHAWTSDDESPYTKGQIPLHTNCKCQELYVLKEEYDN